MRPGSSSSARAGPTCFLFVLLALCISFAATAHALAHPPQQPLAKPLPAAQGSADSSSLDGLVSEVNHSQTNATRVGNWDASTKTLQQLLDALHVMQDKYFVLWTGTWPSSIDWTAAVLATHVAAMLSSLSSRALDVVNAGQSRGPSFLALENTINHFFSHTTTFYFGENAFSLRNQAYDDMLWVVLDWLENVKFQDLHTDLHYPTASMSNNTSKQAWYGTQFQDSAAHRARIFYELASVGWDKTLCDGGMIWNPSLLPYKNAITNELYISASIAMYLYFPGDPIDAPFLTNEGSRKQYPRNPAHLQAAVDAYAWLKNSNMTGLGGLYADGFHISGIDPKSPKCDVLNTMVYTYNQGVVLSGLRGLWLATGAQDYLRDGHELIHKVLRATGWPQTSSSAWAGLGRGGVLEDACDSHASCSQDGQTFKGIFFHHFAEFCRPLRPREEHFLAVEMGDSVAHGDWDEVYRDHLKQCQAYGPWVEHNALAALETRDDEGKFGMWWGLPFDQAQASASTTVRDGSTLPAGAVDYRNYESDIDTLTAGVPRDFNDRGRGRTVETQSGGVAVLRALFQWQTYEALS
ncbi:hypothetical protein N7492_008982 [Penicillium capsulatum]|uniref:Glycosyl hydrolase n=1 Tax=Penicillium capsulatum TaxID=69766 RepID=A0A9W9LHB4_9EURO|nr:hypothetical protein N7492_008982 [Penicillium capsulatum]KAJ6106383.1 hypothetical protein N7512_009900 [Penicillium capsulatum]